MTNIESSKAVGVDQLSGRFLKNDANILAKPISVFCNLSNPQFSQVLVILQNWNLFFKRERKLIFLTTGQSHCFHDFRRSLKEWKIIGMMLIDLQKAFDTIDHEILLQKLKAIKFSESTIKWFKSYLSERIFLVNIKNKLSDFGEISCGITTGVDFRISVVFDLR